jgi:hypothetical protein
VVLEDQIEKVPAEIRSDLVDRNSQRSGYSLDQYQPSNPNILVQDMNMIFRNGDFEKNYPNVQNYILPRLPGYSRDGHMALVYFSHGVVTGGIAEYYLLRKVKGRWEIVLKGAHGFGEGY